MERCEDCPNWAQWQVRTPVREKDPDHPLKTKIVGWKLVSKVCGTHKEAMEAAPQELELHFSFIGASIGHHGS